MINNLNYSHQSTVEVQVRNEDVYYINVIIGY